MKVVEQRILLGQEDGIVKESDRVTRTSLLPRKSEKREKAEEAEDREAPDNVYATYWG